MEIIRNVITGIGTRVIMVQESDGGYRIMTQQHRDILSHNCPEWEFMEDGWRPSIIEYANTARDAERIFKEHIDREVRNMPGRDHVEKLGQHGAYVMTEAGKENLGGAFYDRIVQFCEQYKIGCMVYEMHIPETDEPMQLAIWRNGHVDSGCAEHISAVMDR